jgi:putative NADH-flavin reductase
MRIAVIAAHGRSGQAFVTEALAAGHQVRAGVRGANPFAPHERLLVVQCDATNKQQVTRLIDHCDAVVSLIGHVKGSDNLVQTNAITTVVEAMEVAGVERLISLTGVGVWAPGDKLKPFIDVANWFAARVGVKRFDDGIAHAKVLESSNLKWTILRVLLLTNGKPGKFRLKCNGLVKIPTPRREVARAILQLLERQSFVCRYPIISR